MLDDGGSQTFRGIVRHVEYERSLLDRRRTRHALAKRETIELLEEFFRQTAMCAENQCLAIRLGQVDPA